MLFIKQLINHWYRQSDPLVLGLTSSSYHAMVDRNRTVSRRSKPSSRTTLIGEQPNPWNLLQLQDVMSRHRIYFLLKILKLKIIFIKINNTRSKKNLISSVVLPQRALIKLPLCKFLCRWDYIITFKSNVLGV